jgi:HEAT repeat protein
MVAWTLGILAALGLAWVVGAVAVPVWGTSRAVDRCHEFYIANTLIEDRILALFARTLPDPQIETLDGAREEAASLGPPQVAAGRLSMYLRLPKRCAPHRQAAVLLLGECGEPAVPALVQHLEDGDFVVRLLALRALWQARDPRAVPGLCKMLGHAEWQMRELAAQALGETGDPTAIAHLEEAQNDEDASVRQVVATALKKIRAEEPPK